MAAAADGQRAMLALAPFVAYGQYVRLQRLRLRDADFTPGAARRTLPVKNDLPWFNDAAGAFGLH